MMYIQRPCSIMHLTQCADNAADDQKDLSYRCDAFAQSPKAISGYLQGVFAASFMTAAASRSPEYGFLSGHALRILQGDCWAKFLAFHFVCCSKGRLSWFSFIFMCPSATWNILSPTTVVVVD